MCQKQPNGLQEVRERISMYGVEKAEVKHLLLAVLGGSGDSLHTLADMPLVEMSRLSAEELAEIPGIGPALAFRLTAAFELGKRCVNEIPATPPIINSPEDAAELVKNMRWYEQEQFKVLLLNTKNRLISMVDVSKGTLGAALVHPREVFKEAIRRSAAGVLLAHNHPSGDHSPSREDIEITKRLIDAGDLLGIKVLDHIVIGSLGFTSMKAKGLI